MSLDIRWLAPAALIALAPGQCIAKRYMSFEQAQGLIFAAADEFVAAPVKLSIEQAQLIEKLSGVKSRRLEQQVWQARAKGKFIGWFILDEVIGKHELITYAAGIKPDGTLRQFQIIEYRELYGFQVQDLKWRDQFVGKTIRDPLQVRVDIANITGATMSSEHVTEGLKRLLFLHHVVLR
jgi:Na+-translocating ferredoxin:NAD+ oxidoreductase RnfG subunit